MTLEQRLKSCRKAIENHGSDYKWKRQHLHWLLVIAFGFKCEDVSAQTGETVSRIAQDCRLFSCIIRLVDGPRTIRSQRKAWAGHKARQTHKQLSAGYLEAA